jgi:Mg2+ and Co2+ transporter CorA
MAQKDMKVNISMAEVNIDLAKDTSFLARASKEDSAVMREIAVETKKDSSSMKTVTVLGMLFLPSTLLAVSF